MRGVRRKFCSPGPNSEVTPPVRLVGVKQGNNLINTKPPSEHRNLNPKSISIFNRVSNVPVARDSRLPTAACAIFITQKFGVIFHHESVQRAGRLFFFINNQRDENNANCVHTVRTSI